MVLFHLFYDINLYVDLDISPVIIKLWQLSIAISFFIISGISSNFLEKKENIKRAIKLSILGLLITLITYIFVRDQLIVFGVLNGLGISILLVSFFSYIFDIKGRYFWIFLILFILTYNLSKNANLNFLRNLGPLSIILGFPYRGFYSTDYFPLIPWVFAYIGGRLLGKILIKNNFYNFYGKSGFLSKIGQNSLKIYLLHQVLIYAIVYFFFNILLK